MRKLVPLFLLALSLQAAAQSYPSQPIRMIAPFPPGGSVDIMARLIGEPLDRQLGQRIIVENRSGASGNLGMEAAARATPDGYTILFHSATFSASYVTHKTLPYDTLTDYIPVSAVGISPSVLVAAPSKGFKTAADLITAAKAKPGELNYASAGIGAASHLAAEKFRVAAGIKAQHVPFKGPVEALTEVMAGRIDYYFLPIAPALNNIKSGTVTALAVSSDKRAPQLPDVPTTAEIGLPAAAYAFWNGVFVPAKTPRDVVDRLYQETQKAIADPGVKERLAKLGIEPLPMSQPEFERYFKADVMDTEKLAKEAGIEKQ
jgi:tripartite-type tricarboxylate transporter receptor subunit TctC